MITITFYSYKGGVGRSLLVANAAKYLSTVGKRVFAIDFDLEAPGLHYKFELGPDAPSRECAYGLIDILSDFVTHNALPLSLEKYSDPLEVPKEAGPIRIMWAGTAPKGDYWNKLSAINWHDLFYAPGGAGVPFFFELKEKILEEFSPDFLLIDARTGITEMGGVATTLLPDIVVCLGLGSREHLEGLRAVMHGIRRVVQRDSAPAIDIVPVISRLPLQDSRLEDTEIDRIRAFLNVPVGDPPVALGISDISVLHSEPTLDAGEQLLVGGMSSPYDLPLLRDYLRLFSKIIPAADIRPHVGELIQRATARLLDDPEGAQSNLEALTAYCADADAYRALLKLYRLRKAPLDKIAAAAALMRDMGVSASDPLLLDVVRQIFGDPRDPRTSEIQKRHAEFGEAVWYAAGATDPGMALTISGAYLPERRDRSLRVLQTHIQHVDPPSPAVLARLIDLFRTSSLRDDGLSLVEQYKIGASAAPQFLAAWARLILDTRDAKIAACILEDPLFRTDALRADEPVAFYRLRKLSGGDRPPGLLSELLDQQIVAGSLSNLRELAELFQEEGRADEFELRVRERMPQHVVEDLIEATRRRGRRLQRMQF